DLHHDPGRWLTRTRKGSAFTSRSSMRIFGDHHRVGEQCLRRHLLGQQPLRDHAMRLSRADWGKGERGYSRFVRRPPAPALAVLLVALAACSTSAPPSLRTQSQSLASDQTLRIRLLDGPRSLDPALVQDERE